MHQITRNFVCNITLSGLALSNYLRTCPLIRQLCKFSLQPKFRRVPGSCSLTAETRSLSLPPLWGSSNIDTLRRYQNCYWTGSSITYADSSVTPGLA